MAVLKLKPTCKDYIWGGRRLIDEFDIDTDKKILAEAWMLSCHPDGESLIENDDINGINLSDYLGNKNFPVLIKIIDAHDNLSVQVHPNDEYALIHENQRGKSEVWYVLDAEKDAVLYCGFKKKISRDEFTARIKNNSLLEVLNAVPAHKGDVIFIPAGTVHALGKGVLLVEIQESSNVTYRIFDYGRGRQLHISQALDVANLNPPDNRGEHYPHVAACEYFVVDKLNLDGKILSEASGTVDEKNYLSVLILDGKGTISSTVNQFFFRKGDSFLITESCDWKIRGKCDALLTKIPYA